MTKETWGRYVRAISDNQSEIAERIGSSPSTVSRWMSGDVVPLATMVIQLARAYELSPVAALVAAGYLEPSEITDSGVQPRSLALHEFTEHELAVEMVRRVDRGSTAFDVPLDGKSAAMRDVFGTDVSAGDDTAALANVTQLSRAASKKVPPAKAAKRRQRTKDDQVDD